MPSTRCLSWQFATSDRRTSRLLAPAGLVLLMLAPRLALADYCEGRVQAALTALAGESEKPVGRAERERTQTVLMALCQDAVLAGGGEAPPAAPVALASPPAASEVGARKGADAADRDAGGDEEEPLKILGMEIERAEPGSAGHERLRTKR